MSKQLSLSAAFSVLAMAALALSQGGTGGVRPAAMQGAPMQTGAAIEIAAPALFFALR